MKTFFQLALASSVLASSLATAQVRAARDTADVGPAGSWSVGIFNPLRIAVVDRLELEAHPLVFFVAPNVNARFALLRGTPTGPGDARPVTPEDMRLTAEAGLSLPTFAMRLLKGWTFPSWDEGKDNVGVMLIPRVGLLLSGTVASRHVWTARAGAAFRLPLGPNSAAPLDSFLTPLDLLFSAPLTGFLGRLGGAWDHALGQSLRLRAEANVYLTGPSGRLWVSQADMGPLASLSPVVVTAHLGMDIAVFQHSRVTVGVLWANADQGKSVVVTGADGFADRVRVRSNNILPTVDYIWAGF